MTKSDAAIDAQERKYHHLHGRGDTANEIRIIEGWPMTYEEIAAKAEGLREEALALPEASMSNYRGVLSAYKQMFNDLIVLTRELAKNLEPVNEA